MNPAISICIPTYEMHGRGTPFLEAAFRSIYAQIFTDFEVIVSDHSADDAIEKLCQTWGSAFPLTYLRNTENRGKSAANLNNAIRHAKGLFIKPLFQDDLFYSTAALLQFYQHAQKYPKSWVAAGCWHTNEWSSSLHQLHRPAWHRHMLYGINTLGAPSIVLFKNEGLYFDDTLIWLMDCEFYDRLKKKYGKPVCIKEPLLIIRQGDHSVTNNQATEHVRKEELDYIKRREKKSSWLF
jgi:glycosyltransferase involved in cell wall biosynthesis